jgi:hypothetical protein
MMAVIIHPMRDYQYEIGWSRQWVVILVMVTEIVKMDQLSLQVHGTHPRYLGPGNLQIEVGKVIVAYLLQDST